MFERLLQLDDVRHTQTPEKIASLFQKLGYDAAARQLAVSDLELPVRSAEAVWDAYLIADQRGSKGTLPLQVLLFQLQTAEFDSPSIASNRMRAIAQSLGKRSANFLLLGTTKEHHQLMLVNPRKSFDAQMNLRTSIRKLLIDRANPTNYDRDRLEAIAVHSLNPQELYQTQCEAFDVEKLTKQFYIGYEKLFESVQKVVRQHNPHPYFDDPSRLHQFTQRLLGRIMFLYFLQKKGFLAGNHKFLTAQYKTLGRNTEPEGTEFYSQVLEPLFFETLNKERSNCESRWGQIPYLNGGLFDWDYGPSIQDAAGRTTPEQIQLPNSLFDSSDANSVLGFFNGYNFTVAENVQGDEDVAVDPEMLGKVFENLLAKEERGQSGTFYTPRGIVHFMCVEVLSRYLADESGMSLETIKQLMELDSDFPEDDLKKLLSKEQTKKLKQALEEVKCLDPAVGSGAFPLGMMQVILSVRQAIARREGATVKRGGLTISQWKRDIIANNLYGVDIKPEAIEIAKLRMWLSLVVDVPSIEDLEPLPNLDYKLMCGDSLISTIHGERLIPDPTKTQQGMLAVTPVQQAIQPLLDLQHRYYSAQSEGRKILRQQIVEAEANVFRIATADRRQYWEGKRRKLEQDIRRMGKTSRTQLKEQQAIAEKLAELDRFAAEVDRGERSLSFFQYHLHFNDVFQEKGGFDTVIGNPPYVRQERLGQEYKDTLKAEFPELYKSMADIYTYFYGQGVDLLRHSGYLSFISSNKFMRTGYGDKLRDQLSNQTRLHTIVDFGDLPVFDATTYPAILLLQKQLPLEESMVISMIAKEVKDIMEIETQFKNKSTFITQKSLKNTTWKLEESRTNSLFEKLELSGTTLEKYTQGKICYGIKPGCTKAFVIDASIKNYLISQDHGLERIIKPYLRGRDIKKWSTNWQDLYFLWISWNFPIEKHSTLYCYIQQFRNELESRAETRQGRVPWYALSRYAAEYYQEFDKPKIVYQRFQVKPVFALDSQSCFTNDSIYFYPKPDLYLLAYLNSNVGWWCITKVCPPIQNGYQLIYDNFKKIPVPVISDREKLRVEALAKRLSIEKTESNTEAEINQIFVEALNLTDWEIQQIQGID